MIWEDLLAAGSASVVGGSIKVKKTAMHALVGGQGHLKGFWASLKMILKEGIPYWIQHKIHKDGLGKTQGEE